MAKILITGGTGFLGYHLAVKLLSSGNNEVVLASKSLPDSEDKDFASLLSLPNIKIIKADLTDRSAWKKLGGGYEFVYHLVSIKGFKNFNEIPHEVLRVGILAALNALEWFRLGSGKPNAKILFTSSNEVYTGGALAYENIINPIPENVPAVILDPYDPRWSYAGAKLIGELLFIHYANAYSFRMSIVRPVNIYGPRAGFDGMIPKIIQQAGEKADPFTILGPDDTRTFCFVEDAVDALIRVMESPKTDGQTYNIGGDRQASVKDVTGMIFDAMKWHPKNIIEENSPREAVRNSVPDISKIKRDAGWEPGTRLKEGLAETVKWYQKK
ncbi:MAG: NAD(P)-dependent oxidoreductase [bacterium]|nr:NAD(P)-dependent oxidoreductase [bacterium]